MPLIELHTHSRPHKHGGNSKLLEIAHKANAQGTSYIVLTEHRHTKDFDDLTDEMVYRVEEEVGISIFIGCELKTKKLGDILCYGHDIDYVEQGMEAEDLRSDFCLVWAHPMRRKFSEEEWKYASKHCHAVEVMNKSYSFFDCEYAIRLADDYGLEISGGSDIHIKRHVGICPCYIPKCDDIGDVANHIMAGNVRPMGFPKC